MFDGNGPGTSEVTTSMFLNPQHLLNLLPTVLGSIELSLAGFVELKPCNTLHDFMPINSLRGYVWTVWSVFVNSVTKWALICCCVAVLMC